MGVVYFSVIKRSLFGYQKHLGHQHHIRRTFPDPVAKQHNVRPAEYVDCCYQRLDLLAGVLSYAL